MRLLTGDSRGAVDDCDSAERHNCFATRLYAVREQAKRKLGDLVGADRDLAVFLAKKPNDPRSWCARGERKLAMTPRDAVSAACVISRKPSNPMPTTCTRYAIGRASWPRIRTDTLRPSRSSTTFSSSCRMRRRIERGAQCCSLALARLRTLFGK